MEGNTSTGGAKPKHKVAIMGSGNWGSAIATIIGRNVREHPKLFEEEVRMWVYEEILDGREYLTNIINTKHENVKYLPGVILPTNVIAEPDALKAAEGATLLVFVLPHQFVEGLCEKLKGKLLPGAKAISLIKGMKIVDDKPVLISDIISSVLGIDSSVMCGANIAKDVAWQYFSESTIGYKNLENALLWKKVFHRTTFQVQLVEDVAGVEMCGALKNVVALGVGLCDGLGIGANTKAAIIRIGLGEMRRFAELFFKGIRADTFFESCGIADLIVTCFYGRNRKVASAFVQKKRSWEQLEQELLNGQKMQGTLTAKEVYQVLKANRLTEKFPLFTAIYQISFERRAPASITTLDLPNESRL